MSASGTASVGASSSPASSSRSALRSPVVVLSFLLVAAGILARLVGLTRQGYWSDELFSVGQAHGSLRHMVSAANTEIHPPLFAVLAWSWEHLGGSPRPGWMRLFPALCGCAAPLVAWWGLRRSRLSLEQRALCAAATAGSGMLVVYAQDMRSYSLLALTAVGATAAAIVLASGLASRRAWWTWCGWCFLASATHLFGALLTLWLGLCLVLLRDRWRRTVVLTLVALLPQLAWLTYGAFVPGFAGGTGWIQAPSLHDAADLVTTVFGAGSLHMDPGGFRLGNPLLAVAVALLVVAAVVLRGQRPGLLRSTPPADADASALHAHPSRSGTTKVLGLTRDSVALLLLMLTLGLPVVVFVGSQMVHVWTLRNMIVVAPAWLWSACLLVGSLPRSRQLRQALSLLLLLAMVAGLAGTTVAKQHRYKTDTGRAMDALARIRAANPQAQLYVGGVDVPWLYSSHQPVTGGEFGRLTRPYQVASLGALRPITPASGPTIYLFRTPWGTTGDSADQQILAVAGPGCRATSLVRVALVTCHTR